MADGFSSINPSLHKDTIGGIAANRRMETARRGSSSNRSTPTPTPNVRINGGTVFINGAGFSVAPSLQASFIQNKTGGNGSSAQAAIAQANTVEANRKKILATKKAEIDKLNKLKMDIMRSQISDAQKIDAFNQNHNNPETKFISMASK